MTSAVVLSLDIATTLGWALHKPGMERPFFGSLRLPGGPGDIGWRAHKLREFLRDQHKMHGITHIVFEAQHVSSKIDMKVIQMLLGLAGVAELFAHDKGIRIYKAHISEWRKHFLGRGSGFGKDNPKELALRACETLGWYTDSHDAADACGILDYFLTMIPGHPRPWRDRGLLGAGLNG